MSAKSTNLIVCLLLGLLLFILGCNSVMIPIKKALAPDPNRFPVKSMYITMNIDQREELFTQLQSFAGQHSLESSYNFYDAYKKDFLIVLAGDGFHISVLNTTISPGKISINFYNEASPPISQEVFNKLSIALKNSLNKIPNLIIREKLKRIKITMDENQRQGLSTGFFTQLQNFADRQSLEFKVLTPYDPELRTFLVEMDGGGFQITCDAVRNIPEEINVDFYIHFADNGAPTSTSQKVVDELFNDLNSYFSKIPNVTITDAK